MKTLRTLIWVLLLVPGGCTRQADADSAALDGLLSKHQIDRIDHVMPIFSYGLGTNSDHGKAAQEIVTAMSKTTGNQ